MIRIPCPHCGLRDHSEFTFLGDASVTRPQDGETPDLGRGGEWSAYLFQRRNHRGRAEELWQHVHGCRAWLVVSRDTVTHEVYGARFASETTAP
jgi:sarcosine oxidase subunit delta